MIELLQFRHSPYNEKVRWALDLKRVPHRRRSLLPGPHMATVRKLTGRTTTPVLILDDGRALDGSARIYRFEATVTGPDEQPVTAYTEVKAPPISTLPSDWRATANTSPSSTPLPGLKPVNKTFRTSARPSPSKSATHSPSRVVVRDAGRGVHGEDAP